MNLSGSLEISKPSRSTNAHASQEARWSKTLSLVTLIYDGLKLGILPRFINNVGILQCMKTPGKLDPCLTRT